MSREPVHIAFAAERPDVKAGDRVECRDARGEWFETIAHSEPRYDDAKALSGRCYLTVAVSRGDGVVNWPAEDVRPVTT